MKNKNKYGGMIFLEGDQDSSGGAGYALAHMDNEGGQEGQQQQTQQSNEGGGGAAAAAAPAPAVTTLDPKAFALEFGQVIGQQLQQHQQTQQVQQPLTPEQIAKYQKDLNFWDPDENFLKEFGDIATQKQAFLKMRDGMGKQLLTIVNHLLAERDKQYEAKLSPVQKMIEERTLAERESRFHAKYPILAAPAVQPMVQGAIAHLNASGAFAGKTETEAFEILGKFIEDSQKTFNPAFSLGTAQAASGGTRTGNAIPVTSSGSGGAGVGGGNASGPKKNWALSHMK